MRGAQLAGHDNDGNALSARGVKVGGDVFLIEGFAAYGGVSFASAYLAGSLDLNDARLAVNQSDREREQEMSLDLSHTEITGTLRWLPAKQVRGKVNLEAAAVGELVDEWAPGGGRENGYWPSAGQLNLDGFTYHSLGGYERTKVDQRLTWIRSQYRRSPTGWLGFATQPYEQLAAVYRRAGQDDQARKVAIARRRDLRKYGNLNLYRRLGNRFLDTTIRYGYHTWRTGVALAVLFLIFWWLSARAQQHHLIAWAGDIPGLHFVPSATKCASSYPCFYPFGYTVDTVIPLINVHQADFWGPDASTLWGVAFTVTTWIVTGLGWALATLLVAGYTGLVRRD